MNDENNVPSMDDTILNAFNELNSVETPDQEEEKPVKERDESGRFQAKEQPIEEVPDGEVQEKTEAKPIEGESEYDKPPSTWKPNTKAKWQTLDPEVRAEILRREVDSFQGFEKIKPDLEFSKSVKSIIDPYRAMIAAEGGTPETAINSLFKTAAIFRTGTQSQKQAALVSIANTYGIPLPNGENQSQQQANPDVENINTRLNQLMQNINAREQEQQQMLLEQHTKAADNWMKEKKDGKPIRPFVDNVVNEMQHKVAELRKANPEWAIEKILQDAYESAVWANPETRAALLTEQQAEAKRREENLRKAADAKKAASVNLPKKGSIASKSPNTGTMDETILEAYRQMNSQ